MNIPDDKESVNACWRKVEETISWGDTPYKEMGIDIYASLS
jgi:hypothetical protein